MMQTLPINAPESNQIVENGVENRCFRKSHFYKETLGANYDKVDLCYRSELLLSLGRAIEDCREVSEPVVWRIEIAPRNPAQNNPHQRL